jgi:hypothetical protein
MSQRSKTKAKPVRKPAAKKANKKTAKRTKKAVAPVAETSAKADPRVRNGDKFQVGKPIAADSVVKAARKRRGTIYQPIMDELAKLDAGQSLPVQIPEGLAPKAFHTRLASALRRYGPEAPAGCEWQKDTMEGGTHIAITLAKIAK